MDTRHIHPRHKYGPLAPHHTRKLYSDKCSQSSPQMTDDLSYLCHELGHELNDIGITTELPH